MTRATGCSSNLKPLSLWVSLWLHRSEALSASLEAARAWSAETPRSLECLLPVLKFFAITASMSHFHCVQGSTNHAVSVDSLPSPLLHPAYAEAWSPELLDICSDRQHESVISQ